MNYSKLALPDANGSAGGFAIEKTRGCNHMTCTKCRYQFCWLCLKKYNINHFDGPFACPMMADYNPVYYSLCIMACFP